MTLEQRYILTQATTTPAHEPSGALRAARLFPLVRLDTENPKIDAVRIDYRFAFELDASLDGVNLSAPAGEAAALASPNQAGLFQDWEVPHVEELSHGLAGLWGKRGRGEIHPSTPGAFHAVHLHWRWGRVTQEKGIFHAGEKQFRGVGEQGGPLLDPKIPRQTIRFAITREAPQGTAAGAANPWYPVGEAPSRSTFEELFTKKQPDPSPVAQGERLVLWYSIQVDRRAAEWALRGTVFLHGLFFAHEPEPRLSLLTGTTGPILKPKREKWSWARNPPR